MSAERPKDGWDKAAIVLQPIGGLLAALAVAGLGFFGSQFLERRQSEETRARFYSEEWGARSSGRWTSRTSRRLPGASRWSPAA